MKRILPWLIAAIIVVVLGLLIISNRKVMPRRMNERITLKQKDKIPYGTSVARSLLPSLFPQASITFDNRSPGNWDSIITTRGNQAVILVSTGFNADEDELNRLLNFTEQGNYVFILAKTFSGDASRFFNFSYNEHSFDGLFNTREDSLWVHLESPVFAPSRSFVYPGKRYESSFYALDTAHTVVLGRDEDSVPNFIQLNKGRGRIFIHVAPLAFSNYFILHKNNADYFRQAVSVIPASVDHIVWNEYYLNKVVKSSTEEEPDMYRVLFRYPAFKWGLLTGILMLVLYALLGSRRRQRKIPPYSKPRNDSLDFVKTVGRLYHDRQDHNNLARKMAVYFLEHVRSAFQLPTHTLDEDFIRDLHHKCGYPEKELADIISFIHYLQQDTAITGSQLTQFHRQLELFYQNT